MGRYLTQETIWLGLCGLGAGLVTGLVWRAAGRLRWGAAPFLAATLVATRLTARSDWPHWSSMVAAAVLVILLAGVGAARLLADLRAHWAWVAAGALLSAAGVWAGVPETGPALLAGGGVTGLVAAAGLTRARLAPAAGLGVAAVLGWGAVSGASGRPWATLGGALCTGVAPWLGLCALLPKAAQKWNPGPWLLAAHALLVVFAARWIGVDPHAGWGRVLVAATAGLAVAMATRSRA